MSDIKFYLLIFMRRLPYFLVLSAIGAAVGVALAITLPPRFEAEARLVVESEQIPGDLASSTVRTEAFEQLQLIQQRILTRDRLLDMANRLQIYGTAAEQRQQGLGPDEIVSDLRDRIKIVTTTGGVGRGVTTATLVSVRFDAASSPLAARVTNEVVTLMLQESVRMRTATSGQTLEFFQQEVSRLDEELSRRGAQIVKFKEENSEALPDSLEFRRGQLAAAQERMLQLTRGQAALEDRREGLVALYDRTGGAGLPQPTQTAANMTAEERELRRLQERYATSVAVLSLDNPRIRVLRAQIEALERVVAEQAAAAAGAALEGEDGEVLTAFDLQIADIDNQLKFVADRIAELEVEMTDLQTTIEATPANAITLDTLERDYDNVRGQYNRAIANRAQAETGDIIEALSKGQRISVIEQAVPPAEPTSPDRPLLVAAGVGGGMVLGLSFIVLLELLNTAIRRPVDITKRLDIVPFGTLPYIRTRGETMRKRLMFLTVLTCIVVTIVGGLWAVDSYFMPLDLLMDKIMRQFPMLDFSAG